MIDDLRFAARIARKNPGTTLASFFALAVGIGSSTAIFSVVSSVMLRPLPVPDGDRLVRIVASDSRREDDDVSMADYLDWKHTAHSFSSMAVFRTLQATLSGQAIPERILTIETEWTLLPLLGVTPVRGRNFTPAANQPGASHEVILMWPFWQTHFGGKNVLGDRLLLDEQSYTIIAILPKSFTLLGRRDVLLPVSIDPGRQENKRGFHSYEVLARLAPRVSIKQANAELASLAAATARAFPQENKGVSAKAIDLRSSLSGEGIGASQKYVRPALLLLLAAVLCVLLIACGNVAHIHLVRAWSRRHEMAVRLALGATHGRLFRQLLGESVLLSLAGAFSGLLLAAILVRLFRHLPINAVPRLEETSLDWRVLLFALTAGILSGIGFGLAPALRARSMDVNDVLKESTGRATASRAQARLRQLFVTLQTGLAVALLVECGLLINSFIKASRISPNFSTDHLLTLYLSLPPSRYNARDYVSAAARLDALLHRVQAAPGVVSAALASDLPLSGTAPGGGILFEGRELPKQFWSAPYVVSAEVSPEYFRTMQIALLAGRSFTDRDRFAKVVIINQTLAQRFFRTQSPIGQRVAIASGNPRWQEIVGVVADAPQGDIEDQVSPQLFFPLTVPLAPWVAVAVRLKGDPQHYVEPLRSQIAKGDRGVAVFLPRSVTEIMSKQLFWRRLQTWLVAVFALSALALASLGLYAVIAYSVGQRTREIGLRMALGVSAERVWRSILWHGIKPAIAGAAVGLLCGFAAAHLTARLLFATSAGDITSYLAAATLVLIVAALATFLPAWRAARIDPARALRHE